VSLPMPNREKVFGTDNKWIIGSKHLFSDPILAAFRRSPAPCTRKCTDLFACPGSLTGQMFPHVLVSQELARVHALADLLALLPELGIPHDEKVDHIVIEREHGITALAFGFEHDSLGACGL